MMFDALLFDLDGTLVDTESLALISNQRAFAEMGYQVEAGFLHQMIGKDEAGCALMIAQAFPDIDLATLSQSISTHFQSALDLGLPLKSGVSRLMAATEGRRRAVVTSSGRASAARKLQIAGLAQHFELVITVEDVSAAKPSPEPYLLAAHKMGLAPESCLVFEDSEVGAEAGFRAGCIVVQVPDVLPASGRWAHHIASDLISGAERAGLKL